VSFANGDVMGCGKNRAVTLQLICDETVRRYGCICGWLMAVVVVVVIVIVVVVVLLLLLLLLLSFLLLMTMM
jgi:hypothetical protein